MIGPYWFSEDRWAARGLLLAVVLLTLGMVYLTVLLNQWNNAFYSALQDKDLVAFRGQLFRVTWLIGIFIFLAVYQVYLNQMLEIRWRRWLTDRYLRAWLADGAYYRMQLVARETDNPDQRIAEDVHLLAAHTLGLFDAVGSGQDEESRRVPHHGAVQEDLVDVPRLCERSDRLRRGEVEEGRDVTALEIEVDQRHFAGRALS